MKDVKSIVKRAAEEAGFDLSGVASAIGARELEYFPHWIAAGHAGEMKYMEARDEEGELKRASLARVAPWARSVIVCAINYNVDQPYSTEVKNPSRGWISRYAWGREDYHEAVLRRLKQVEASLQEAAEGVQTRSYVDTGPIVERVFAKYAGVGWIGKNTCVINQQKGSWLFLGVILASVEIEPDVPAPDRCGTQGVRSANYLRDALLWILETGPQGSAASCNWRQATGEHDNGGGCKPSSGTGFSPAPAAGVLRCASGSPVRRAGVCFALQKERTARARRGSARRRLGKDGERFREEAQRLTRDHRQATPEAERVGSRQRRR